MAQSPFKDNPIARREALAFLRRAFIWIPALLAVWIPMTWVTRILVRDIVGGNVTALAGEVLMSLSIAFRPDVLIALLLVQRSASRDSWHALQGELSVTFLTAGRIIFGKAVVPIVILSILHACGVGYYYADLVHSPDYFVTFVTDGPSYAMGIPIMILAFVEDVLFAGVVVLIALRTYLIEPDAFRATLGALWRLLLFGLAVAGCSWAWLLILNILPNEWLLWLIIDYGRFVLMGNVVWFALVLPMEALVILFLWRRLRSRLNGWLQKG